MIVAVYAVVIAFTIPSLGLDKHSPYCSVAEYSYPVIFGLDISWLTYCQQVYGDVLLEISLDDHSSFTAFVVHDSDTIITSTKRVNTTAINHSSTSADSIVRNNEVNIGSSDSSKSSLSDSNTFSRSDYLRLARITETTRQHVNIYYENTSIKILPLDWTYDSETDNIIVSDTTRLATRSIIIIITIWYNTTLTM